MYKDYFGFRDQPFSIAPDPHYLFLSEQHKEALAHLLYGVGDQGGFVLLSGEVGTGKTTVCRSFLQQIPENCEVAYIVNPRQSAIELLCSICDEFGVYYYYQEQGSNYLVELINEHLLSLHASGKHAVLIIDEAQNLSTDVLEQLRLLTNLETDHKKLLQLVLLGQPELNQLLARRELRQLAQRITARFHLQAMTERESRDYIAHRLRVAGFGGTLFSPEALKMIYRHSSGTPRLINIICDRCLLGLYSVGGNLVDKKVCRQAISEVSGFTEGLRPMMKRWAKLLGSGSVIGAILVASLLIDSPTVDTQPPSLVPAAATSNSSPADTSDVSYQRLLANIAVSAGVNLDPARSSSNVCEFLLEKAVHCVQSLGNLEQISSLKSPVLIRTATGDWQQLEVLDESSALLSFSDGHQQQVTADTIQQPLEYHWLWRKPEFYRPSVSLGESDEFVAWLARRIELYMDALDGTSNDAKTNDAPTFEAMLGRTAYLINNKATKPVIASTELLRAIREVQADLKLSGNEIAPELVQVLHQLIPTENIALISTSFEEKRG